MKRFLLLIGILSTIILAVYFASDKKPLEPIIEPIVGNVTNPKDFDYIAPVDVNGTPINYVYTDDNVGEDLIIATDNSTYSSWDSAYVNFAIKNTSATDQTVKVQFLYDGGASASEIEELVQDVAYQVTIQDRGSKDYKCDSGWLPFETPLQKENVFSCGKEQPKHCDSIVKNTCTVNDDVLSTHQETRYKDVYVPIAKGTVENLKSRDVKSIDSKFVAKEQVSNFIQAGETKHYRAKINFSPKSGGEFYINAYGSNGSIGHLDPFYSSSWLYRKAITIDETKVSGSADHSNFSVLVDLTDSGLQANAQADGDDILFTSADGTTKLDHQIEVYTSATGRLTAWVEIPTLSYNTNTVIYMYYGNSGATNQQNVNGTWSSSYKAVWHQPDGTTLSLTDSTSNAHNGTNFSSTATAAKIYGGADFVQASSQYWTAGDHADFTFGNGGTDSAFTYSFWANLNTISGSHTDTWIEKYVTFGSGEYAIVPYFDSILTITNDTTGGYVGRKVTTASTYMTAGTWYYITWTYNGNKTNAGHKIYINGTQRDDGNFGGGTYTGMVDSGAALNMGKNNGLSGQYLDGKLDEIRLYAGERNSDWILTEYNNQSATSTFYTIGTQETDTPTTTAPDDSGWFLLF